MSKKIVTLLLLAVFVLAQFSMASAAALASGTVSITNTLGVFNAGGAGSVATIDWSAADMPAAAAQNVLIWSRLQAPAPAVYGACQDAGSPNSLTAATGSFDYDVSAYGNGETVEFYVTLEDVLCAGGTAPLASKAPMASTTIDANDLQGFMAVPPSLSALAFGTQPVACNTFENWAIAQDNRTLLPTEAYSGFGSWNQLTQATFAPAPEGDDSALLEWPYTIAGPTGGTLAFSVNPEDAAGLQNGVMYFRTVATTLIAAERADCTTFTDVAGDANELYINYLADVDLIAGLADGSYAPSATLSRAEAATLFAKANGWTEATLPAIAPSAACNFTDVAAADWFQGWVWAACGDGYMNGVGAGLFDPNALLTRGQVVTIFNNVSNAGAAVGTYLDTVNVLNGPWGNDPYRTAAFTDVFVGAYYANPVLFAYGTGVADGTSATTFGPDEPATRGEFAKMLYRALSIVAPY